MAPKTERRICIPCVRGNIGSQFHKVEHRLVSLISSRALFSSHGKSPALAELIVFMLTRNIFNVHDKLSCRKIKLQIRKKPSKLNLNHKVLFSLCGEISPLGPVPLASRVAHTWDFLSEGEHVARGDEEREGSINGFYFFGACRGGVWGEGGGGLLTHWPLVSLSAVHSMACRPLY